MAFNIDDNARFLAPATNYDDVPTLRTQYGLTRSEIIQGVANRLMYSKFYIMLYSAMAVMSLVSIVLSIKDTCPTLLFIALESIINLAMIIEVAVRVLALGRNYWASKWNLIDLILVLLCCITLIVISTGCSVAEREEAILDAILLGIRNVVQLFRLAGMLRRNRHTLSTRAGRIDFSDVSPANRRDVRGDSLYFDADDVEDDEYV